MATSPQQIASCLAMLRAAGINPPVGTGPTQLDLMVAFWHERLKDYDQPVVNRSFRRWADEKTSWPQPKHFLPILEQETARQQAKPVAKIGDPLLNLNKALERAMALTPGSLLVRLDQYHYTNPKLRQKIINTIADWALVHQLHVDEKELGRKHRHPGEFIRYILDHHTTKGYVELEPNSYDEIRATAKLVLEIEARPQDHIGAPHLAKIGRTLIQRHIEAGRAPSDVVEWFKPVEAAP